MIEFYGCYKQNKEPISLMHIDFYTVFPGLYGEYYV